MGRSPARSQSCSVAEFSFNRPRTNAFASSVK
jgi:hypothetical protein